MTVLVRGWLGAWLALSFLAGCGSGDEDTARPEEGVPVAAWTVRSQEVEIRREWTGRLEPLRTVAVQAPRGGRVSAVPVRDGDRVQEGTVVVRMVGPDLEARRATLEERRAQLQEELERWERLARSGAAGPGEVAEARLRLLQAREQAAELEALEASYVIRAPATGRVYGAQVSPGASVAGGQTLLSVEDDDTWGVGLSVPAWEAPLFRDPTLLSVRDGSESYTVSRVASTSEVQPGFVRIDLYLREVEPFRRGMTVEYRDREQAIVIPWTAVAGDSDRHWVALIVPGDPDRVVRRTVELGRAHAEGVGVGAGLEDGDRIIRYEPRSHPEGRAVRPVENGG